AAVNLRHAARLITVVGPNLDCAPPSGGLVDDGVGQRLTRPDGSPLAPVAHGAHVPIGKVQALPASDGRLGQEGVDVIERIVTALPGTVQPADIAIFMFQITPEVSLSEGIAGPVPDVRVALVKPIPRPFGRVLGFAVVATGSEPDAEE